MLDKDYIASTLNESKQFLGEIGIGQPTGAHNRSKEKKLSEVIGLCEHLFKVINNYIEKKEEIVFLECSCGKSYLSFVINFLLNRTCTDIKPFFYGIDKNSTLIDKCNEIKTFLNCRNMRFVADSTINYLPERKVDVVIALHACDTATDEAILKGIEIGAKFIIVVPCCQNQIRSQLKSKHSLTALTDFGLLRYRFADLLTDGLRSQYLRGYGYSVELKEITTIRNTPKNLIIIARKKRKVVKKSLNAFYDLSKAFNIQSKLLDCMPDYVC